MNRVMVQLRAEQESRLKAIARVRGVSISELVRQGVDCVIEREDPQDMRKRRALSAIGCLNSGEPDISIRHDEFGLGEV